MQNQPEQIVPMTIRMMNKIKVSANKQTTHYENTPIAYISLVARKQQCYQKPHKGVIIVNDDTGTYELVISLMSEIDQNLYNKINQDYPTIYYYNFILRIRVINNNLIHFDIQTIQQINQSAQVLYQLISIMTWKTSQNTQKGIQVNDPIQDEEDKQQQIDIDPLKDQILKLIVKNSQSGIKLQKIQECFDHSIATIQDIKKCISSLQSEGLIVNESETIFLVEK